MSILWKHCKEKVLSPEEVSYLISLQESQPLLVLGLEHDYLTTAAGALKELWDCAVVSIHRKTSKKHASANMKSLSKSSGIVLVASDSLSLAASLWPSGLKLRTVLHFGSFIQADRFLQSEPSILAPDACGIVSRNSPDSTVLSTYELHKSWFPAVQSRVAAARRLHRATTGSSSAPLDPKGSNVAAQVEALRNRLKVILSMPLPGGASTSISTGSSGVAEQEDGKTLRVKMLLLGMLQDPTDKMQTANVPRHDKSEEGRILAATKWMDGKSGKEFHSPWGVVRYGASCDCKSVEVAAIIRPTRDFVRAKRARRAEGDERGHSSKKSRLDSLSDVLWEEEYIPRVMARWRRSERAGNAELSAPGCLPCSATIKDKCKKKSTEMKAANELNGLRIIGFGWQPNPSNEQFDSDKWQGAFGKPCGHNEVAMFYCRPFAPMEVLNTHVCSKLSPAPGNQGYDGCLEFLQAQCRWFGRPFTVWDTEYLHFISAEGDAMSSSKKELLSMSLNKLRVVIPTLRALTVECGGAVPPLTLLSTVQCYLDTYANRMRLPLLQNNPKCQRLIGQFLLEGSNTVLQKAAFSP